MAADAVFASRDADENLVFYDKGCGSASLTPRGIAVFHRPNNFPGFRIERDESRIGLILENLAIGIGDAAVDRIAAHDRDDIGILLWLVFPQDLALLIQVERPDDVWERRIE